MNLFPILQTWTRGGLAGEEWRLREGHISNRVTRLICDGEMYFLKGYNVLGLDVGISYLRAMIFQHQKNPCLYWVIFDNFGQ
jgi:hypothetical protein